MTPEEILALLNLIGELATKGFDAYEKMKELAAKSGISEADLAAADARFGIEIHDPLASEPKPVTDPPFDAYSIEYSSAAAAKGAAKPGDKIYDKHDGHFRLVYGGAGGFVPPSWTEVN